MISIDMNRDDLCSSILPIEVQGILTCDQWLQIYQSWRNASHEGHIYACCLEIACCIIFSFPFIFLCHICFSAVISSTRLDSRLASINRVHFNSQPVIKRQHNLLFIDTQYLPVTHLTDIIIIPSGSETVADTSEPVLAQAEIYKPEIHSIHSNNNNNINEEQYNNSNSNNDIINPITAEVYASEVKY